jgi:murein DD-endopeptidase MepM/ murein hydrolase activator NlpD
MTNRSIRLASSRRFICCLAVLVSLLPILACDSSRSPTGPLLGGKCTGYPAWENSMYVLPFPVGETHRVSQGNCTNQSHQGTLRYSYDLEMPFGSVVTAARDGVVLSVRVDQPTGTRGLTSSNYVQIRHDDGLVSDYVHLAPGGNLVQVGQAVRAGDPVAITGHTGDVGTYPHVHFNISPCANNLACDTRPVTFSNTAPNPIGLVEGAFYQALPY